MANHAISWVSGAHVHFGDLDFIVTLGGELALAQTAVQSLPSVNFSHRRLEGQPSDSLGPQSSREAPRCITLSLECHVRSAPIVFPFGLRNATATASHLVAQRMIPFSANNEFVGMIEQVTESLHGLLVE